MPDSSKCSVTHPQIASGTCPHCGWSVAESPTAAVSIPGVSSLRWNIARLLEDLDRGDETTRLTTISNVSDHLPPLDEALPVVREAFQDRDERVRAPALTAAVRLSVCSDEHFLVETCESLLRQDPADLAALHVLLYFYTTAQARSGRYRDARHALILRLIVEMPDAPQSLGVTMKLFGEEDAEVFERAKALWLAQIERHWGNPRVLATAYVFFVFIDDVMAGKLLRRCKELEPDNPHWARELGRLYAHQGPRQQPDSSRDWGLMGLAELESAWKAATTPNERFHALLQIPAVALQAGEIEKARRYAEMLLAATSEPHDPLSQIWGDREANMVLGWYALSKNDFDSARARLFAARTPGAVYLSSCYCFMDPLMKLVAWMLYRDQREAVLEYLRRDQELVPEFRDRLAGWARDIEQGRTPDFQARELLAENLQVATTLASRPPH
jgi:hypothetical protein